MADGTLLVLRPVCELLLRSYVVLRSSEGSLPVLLEQMGLVSCGWFTGARCRVAVLEIGGNLIVLITVGDVALLFQVSQPILLGPSFLVYIIMRFV